MFVKTFNMLMNTDFIFIWGCVMADLKNNQTKMY